MSVTEMLLLRERRFPVFDKCRKLCYNEKKPAQSLAGMENNICLPVGRGIPAADKKIFEIFVTVPRNLTTLWVKQAKRGYGSERLGTASYGR